MTAIVTAFPSARIVRRLTTTTPRMTETDLDTLRAHWPPGWQATLTTDDGVDFDMWCVPSAAYIDDLSLSLIVTLQPSGAWTLHDALGRLIKTGQSVADVV